MQLNSALLTVIALPDLTAPSKILKKSQLYSTKKYTNVPEVIRYHILQYVHRTLIIFMFFFFDLNVIDVLPFQILRS